MTVTKKKKNKGGRSKKLAPPTKSTEANEIQRDVDQHPLVIGHFVVVTFRDGSNRLAKIICTSSRPTRGAGDISRVQNWEYYVHYVDFNRRMDEWITIDRIVKLPSVANIQGEKSSQAPGGAPVPGVESEDSDVEMSEGGASSEGDESNAVIAPTRVIDLEHDEHEGMDAAALREHEEVTKVKNIRNVLLGRHIMECWYFSPYPKEIYPHGPIDCLFVCEFTFRFFCTRNELVRFQQKSAVTRHPPGNEIYRDSSVSMFELDGAVEKVYCQNLCYFAKLFLDHKTLYWDVDPFLFYVLATRDERGYHPVGFFSKEK